jgi:hypothetical protein
MHGTIHNTAGKTYGFCLQRGMGYGTMQFPANQVGEQLRLWDKRGYGLSEVWVMTVY